VILPRLRASTLILMTALVVICSVVPALWLGYHIGRRAGATKRRTRRGRLGKLAIRLFALIIASRTQRSMQRKLSAEWPGFLMSTAAARRRRGGRSMYAVKPSVVKRLSDLRYSLNSA
jgi:hypothetical protein